MSSTRGITKALLASVLGLGLVAGAVSCGGQSTNNDQGTSFLAFGYFTTGEDVVPVTGAQVALAPDTATIVDTQAGFQLDGNQVIVRIGLQNRLSSQFIRVERIECSYSIPGAGSLLSIPDDSYNTAFIIGPSSTDDGDPETIDPQLGVPLGDEETEGNTGSALYYPFPVVSTDLMSFINVNRNLLPELPFRLNATCHAVGVTQAGDVFVTNPLQFQVGFFDQAECCTGSNLEQPSIGDDGDFQLPLTNAPDVGGEGGTFTSETDEDGDSTPTGSSSSAA